jgi:hypothetical protein
MKTRTSDQQPGHGLPPPPAPTARDANPWPMSSTPTGMPPPPRHPRASGRRPSPPVSAGGAARPRRALPWIPLVVLFFILGTGVQMAIRALSEGDVETAAGALVILAVVALVALGRLVKGRRG